jgi:hypothetical protein
MEDRSIENEPRQIMERLTHTCLGEHFEFAQTAVESADQINPTGNDCKVLIV